MASTSLTSNVPSDLSRRGIILAGGRGSRLLPATRATSKQLLPVYNKPMIYYPLTVLMLAGVREVLIITTSRDSDAFKELFGDGNHLGISISYVVQSAPRGIAEAFILGADFLDGHPSVLILGDNIFYSRGLADVLARANHRIDDPTIFAYYVRNPRRYGVVELDESGRAVTLEEKPLTPRSSFAVPGLYFYGADVVDRAQQIQPSERGELEVTDLNRLYLDEERLYVERFGRGTAWMDCGTFDALLDASQFIASVETRQGLMVGSPEEVAWRSGWIDDDMLGRLSKRYESSSYGVYLRELLDHRMFY